MIQGLACWLIEAQGFEDIRRQILIFYYVCIIFEEHSYTVSTVIQLLGANIVVFTNKRSQAKVYTVYFGISSV